MGILIFLLVITMTIALHEYGHYLACRAFKIPVTEFSIGVGKSLLRWCSRSGTEWHLRLLPLGGFILPNEDKMQSASPLAKAIVAAAGPLANLIPFMILTMFFGTFGMFMNDLWNMYLAGFGAIGQVLWMPFDLLGSFFTPETVGSQLAATPMVGPIGIGAETATVPDKTGILMFVFVLFFILNIGVALINLLPIPLLDGGRIALAGVEAISGRAFVEKIEGTLNVIGAILIGVVFLVVTTSDTIKLF